MKFDRAFLFAGCVLTALAAAPALTHADDREGVAKTPVHDSSEKGEPAFADNAYVERERAKGKSPAQIIMERQDARDYLARCPDTALSLDDECAFTDAMGRLKGDARATQRIEAAIRECAEYPQTTINFCVGKLSQAVERELEGLYEKSLAVSRAADAAKIGGCKTGTGLACGGGMHHTKSLFASQASWTDYADNQCFHQTEGNVGGSGYASFGMICWLNLGAERIDQLSQTKLEIFEAKP